MITDERIAALRAQRDALLAAQAHQKHAEELRLAQRRADARADGRRAAAERMTYAEIQAALKKHRSYQTLHAGEWIQQVGLSGADGQQQFEEHREWLRGVAEVAAML